MSQKNRPIHFIWTYFGSKLRINAVKQWMFGKELCLNSLHLNRKKKIELQNEKTEH